MTTTETAMRIDRKVHRKLNKLKLKLNKVSLSATVDHLLENTQSK